jgi:hypothetical protein
MDERVELVALEATGAYVGYDLSDAVVGGIELALPLDVRVGLAGGGGRDELEGPSAIGWILVEDVAHDLIRREVRIDAVGVALSTINPINPINPIHRINA